jgi:hypothetical protein
MKITLAGMEYRCHSPSLFELIVSPGHEAPWLGCAGPGTWRIGSALSWGARTFSSRQEAAQLIRDAFEKAGRENLA